MFGCNSIRSILVFIFFRSIYFINARYRLRRLRSLLQQILVSMVSLSRRGHLKVMMFLFLLKVLIWDKNSKVLIGFEVGVKSHFESLFCTYTFWLNPFHSFNFILHNLNQEILCKLMFLFFSSQL